MAYSEQSGVSGGSQHTQSNPAGSRDRIRQPTGDPNDPYGLGDPNDQSLRKVERDIMIPMKMRDRAKAEKCIPEVQAFTDCCKAASVLMVVKCRNQNTNLKACLTKWYNDEEFKKQCTEEYLHERTEYRRTGIKQKDMKKYLG